jgi:hypothetical protein
MLDVKVSGSRVIGRIFGAPETKRNVRLLSSRVTWTRPRIPASGGPARPGKRVTISRVVQLADGSVRREVVSRDVYAPAPGTGRSVRRSRRSSYRRSPARRRSARSPARDRSRSPNAGSRPVASQPRSTAPPPTSLDSTSAET